MLNSQRLSAMIDSLHHDESDSHLLNISKPTNVTPDKRESGHLGACDGDAGSPSKLFRSPAGLISLNSTDNRASMISNYSGIVQEGVEISYVVKNQKKLINGQSLPSLPAFPSVETLKANGGGLKEDDEQSIDDVVIKTVVNAKPVVRLNSASSKVSASSDRSSSNSNAHSSAHESLKLLSIKRRQMAASSIGSGNLASESGSSYYNHFKDHEKSPLLPRNDDTPSAENIKEKYKTVSPSLESSDNSSIATSIIPPLRTKIRGSDDGIPPARSETNSFNPTIPPRNKNRPRSRMFIRDTLDDIENQLMEQMRDPNLNDKGTEGVTRTSSNTNKSDTYFSAASSQDLEDQDIHDGIQPESRGDEEHYLSRPLPNVPNASLPRRDSTIRAKNVRPTSQQDNASNAEIAADEEDDQYEDINDDTEQDILEQETTKREPLKQITSNSQKTTQPNKKIKRKKNKKQELRSFDIDTLSQLLNVTKGTLIGAEFANLGMKVEEKRALERLVDSLSRLTADMVLDPERYEEGLKRLDQATRALEGF